MYVYRSVCLLSGQKKTDEIDDFCIIFFYVFSGVYFSIAIASQHLKGRRAAGAWLSLAFLSWNWPTMFMPIGYVLLCSALTVSEAN